MGLEDVSDGSGAVRATGLEDVGDGSGAVGSNSI
jgi:hypothetical protein